MAFCTSCPHILRYLYRSSLCELVDVDGPDVASESAGSAQYGQRQTHRSHPQQKRCIDLGRNLSSHFYPCSVASGVYGVLDGSPLYMRDVRTNSYTLTASGSGQTLGLDHIGAPTQGSRVSAYTFIECRWPGEG